MKGRPHPLDWDFFDLGAVRVPNGDRVPAEVSRIVRLRMAQYDFVRSVVSDTVGIVGL